MVRTLHRQAGLVTLVGVDSPSRLLSNAMKSFAFFAAVLLTTGFCFGQSSQPKKLVLMAGKPSHPPRMHEFNAGVQLLAKCLQGTPQVRVDVVLNGWPQDEALF